MRRSPILAGVLGFLMLAGTAAAAPPSETAALVGIAEGEDAAAALGAIDELSLRADGEAFRAVAEISVSDDEGRSRRAQAALGRSPLPLEALVGLLTSEKETSVVRSAAAWQLGHVGSEVAVPALMKALENEDGRLRTMAAVSLGRIGDERAMDALLLVANKDEHLGAQQAATAALELLSDKKAPKPPAPIEPHLDALVSVDNGTRERAALALAKSESRRAVGPLIEAARKETDVNARRAMIEALGEIADGVAAPFVLEVLGTAKGALRYSCIASLANFKDPRAQQALGRIVFDDDDPGARLFAVRALGWIGGEKSQHLVVAALTDRSPRVRREAVLATEKVNARGSSVALIGRLQDPEAGVRAEATRVLGAWQATEAVDALLGLLDDPDPVVQRAAVIALGRAGDERAAQALAQIIAAEAKKPEPQQDKWLMDQATESIRALDARTRNP